MRATNFTLTTVLVLLWGLNWPAASLALKTFPPLTFRVFTLALGAALLFVYCAACEISLRLRRCDLRHVLIGSCLNVIAWNLLSVLAIVHLDAARSAIVAFTMPFWTVLIERGLGRTSSPTQNLVVAMGALGVGGLVLAAAMDTTFDIGGMLLMALAALCWAVGTVYVKRSPSPLPPAAYTAWSIAFGAATLSLLLPFQEGPHWPDSPPLPGLAALAYATCIGMALCQACWLALVNRIGPASASLALLGIPPVGVLSSVWLLRSAVSPWDIASLGLLTGAAALAALDRHRAQRPG